METKVESKTGCKIIENTEDIAWNGDDSDGIQTVIYLTIDEGRIEIFEWQGTQGSHLDESQFAFITALGTEGIGYDDANELMRTIKPLADKFMDAIDSDADYETVQELRDELEREIGSYCFEDYALYGGMHGDAKLCPIYTLRGAIGAAAAEMEAAGDKWITADNTDNELSDLVDYIFSGCDHPWCVRITPNDGETEQDAKIRAKATLLAEYKDERDNIKANEDEED